MNKYLALDIETGGIGIDKSLLTAYLAILDENLEITNDLYLRCKPKDGIYKVTGKAMEINGIDLALHDKIASTYEACGTALYQCLEKNKNAEVLKPIGHGVRMDMFHICDKLVSETSWWKFVSYRCLDTSVLGGFAIELGLMPHMVNASLDAMAQYFGVGHQKEKHNAKDDVLLTIAVYKSLVNLFKEKK